MSILISVLLILEVVVAFLLIVVILAQKSKDQGLGMAFGGGMGESLFGSRAGNVLTRMTITLATVFMINTMLLGILFARKAPGTGSVMDRADRAAPMAPDAPMAPAGLPAATAPMMADDMPFAPMASDEMPADIPSAPVVMHMDESGELVPLAVEAGRVEVVSEPVAVSVAPVVEEEELVIPPVEATEAVEGIEIIEAVEAVEAVDLDLPEAEAPVVSDDVEDGSAPPVE